MADPRDGGAGNVGWDRSASKLGGSTRNSFMQEGDGGMTSRRAAIDIATLGGAEFIDPLNLRGVKPPQYQFDQAAFQLPTANQTLYGGMGLSREGRQINPETEGLLRGLATGQAPSAAQIQLMQGLGQQQRSAMSMAASNPNVSPEMAQRLANQAQTEAQLQTNSQMAALRADEQARFIQALSGRELQEQALNDRMVTEFMQMGLDADQAQLKASMELEKAKAAELQAANERQQQEKGAVFGAAGSVLGGLLKTSDRRAKKDIRPGDELTRAFLKAIKPYSFKYKDEANGRGDELGVMAQDLEKSDMGKAMVREVGGKKAVDLGRALMGALAGVAHVEKRLTMVEAIKGKAA